MRSVLRHRLKIYNAPGTTRVCYTTHNATCGVFNFSARLPHVVLLHVTTVTQYNSILEAVIAIFNLFFTRDPGFSWNIFVLCLLKLLYLSILICFYQTPGNKENIF